MSSLLIAVDFSSARAMSAPFAGSCGVDGEAQPGVRVGASDEIADRGELLHELGEPAGVELADAPAVLRQLARAGVGFVEERVDARFRLAVDQRLDVPRDVGRGPVSFCEWSCRETQGLVSRGETERFRQRLGVHDHEVPRRAGEHDVEQAQAGGVGGDEARGLDDDDVVELEALGVERRQHRDRRVDRLDRVGDRAAIARARR